MWNEVAKSGTKKGKTKHNLRRRIEVPKAIGTRIVSTLNPYCFSPQIGIDEFKMSVPGFWLLKYVHVEKKQFKIFTRSDYYDGGRHDLCYNHMQLCWVWKKSKMSHENHAGRSRVIPHEKLPKEEKPSNPKKMNFFEFLIQVKKRIGIGQIKKHVISFWYSPEWKKLTYFENWGTSTSYLKIIWTVISSNWNHYL